MCTIQDDVTAASKYVEGEVRRLLGGSCEAWEMVMTVRAPPASTLCQCTALFLPTTLLRRVLCTVHSKTATWQNFSNSSALMPVMSGWIGQGMPSHGLLLEMCNSWYCHQSDKSGVYCTGRTLAAEDSRLLGLLLRERGVGPLPAARGPQEGVRVQMMSGAPMPH